MNASTDDCSSWRKRAASAWSSFIAVAMDLIRTSSPTNVTTTGPPLQSQGFAVLGGDAQPSSRVDPGYVRIHPTPRDLGTGEARIIAEPFAHSQSSPSGPRSTIHPRPQAGPFCWRNGPHAHRSVVMVFLALIGNRAFSGLRKISGRPPLSPFLFAHRFAKRRTNDGLRDSRGVVPSW